MAHVFISYRSPDRPFAVEIKDELTASGHKVWLDVDNVKIGGSIVQLIDSGLFRSSYLLLCLSGAGTSAWMDREWMSTLDRQLNGAAVKILPILLPGGQMPAIICDLRYANLAKNWKLGIKELKVAMR